MQDIASHIMDIVKNSIRANAGKVEILVGENPQLDSYVLSIKDNGDGMDSETLARITDPFYTSRKVRKVGLGIPLLKHNAEATGGNIEISSEKGKGTSVTANFTPSHIDMPPEGDVAGTIVLMLIANPNIELIYKHIYNNGEFIINLT